MVTPRLFSRLSTQPTSLPLYRSKALQCIPIAIPLCVQPPPTVPTFDFAGFYVHALHFASLTTHQSSGTRAGLHNLPLYVLLRPWLRPRGNGATRSATTTIQPSTATSTSATADASEGLPLWQRSPMSNIPLPFSRPPHTDSMLARRWDRVRRQHYCAPVRAHFRRHTSSRC